MIKFEYPTAPMVIAIILGAMVEEPMRQSLILSDGSGMIFVTKPILLVFFILTLFLTFSPFVPCQWCRRKMDAVIPDQRIPRENAQDKT